MAPVVAFTTAFVLMVVMFGWLKRLFASMKNFGWKRSQPPQERPGVSCVELIHVRSAHGVAADVQRTRYRETIAVQDGVRINGLLIAGRNVGQEGELVVTAVQLKTRLSSFAVGVHSVLTVEKALGRLMELLPRSRLVIGRVSDGRPRPVVGVGFGRVVNRVRPRIGGVDQKNRATYGAGS